MESNPHRRLMDTWWPGETAMVKSGPTTGRICRDVVSNDERASYSSQIYEAAMKCDPVKFVVVKGEIKWK
jgi:hypothetical protein